MSNTERIQRILSSLKVLLVREDLDQLPIVWELRTVDETLDECRDAEKEL